MTTGGTAGVVLACGLGPAGPEYLNDQVRAAMASAPAYLRTSRHVAAEPFVSKGAIPLDRHYETATSFEAAYAAIVEELVEAANQHGRIAYGVPGSPLVLERTVELLRSDPRVRVESFANCSFLDLVWSRLGVDPVSSSVRLIDGDEFTTKAAGERGPLLVAQLWSRAILSDLKVVFEEPPRRRVVLLHHLGHDDEQIVELDWSDLDRSLEPDHLSCLYIPELASPVASELVRAEEIVRVLRERCPWDAAQTHASLVRHLIEETYEAIDAIDQLGEPPALDRADLLEEELGDVLCQVLFHSRLAAEEGLFSLSDVARTLSDKLVSRHPHVFGDTEAPNASAVLSSWEQSKLEEKGRSSVMEGIPTALPALVLAEKVLKKTAAIGLGELAAEELPDLSLPLESLQQDESSLGTLLLAIVAEAVRSGLSPESALRHAAKRLRDQVEAAERGALERGTAIGELPLEERRQHLRP